MSNEEVVKQVEEWVRLGLLNFDKLQSLAEQAYAKEAAQDEQE